MKTFKATIITQYGSIVEKQFDAECVLQASQQLKKENPGCIIRQINLVKNDNSNIVVFMDGDQVEISPKALWRHKASQKSHAV